MPSVSLHVLRDSRLIMDLETEWNMKSGGSSKDNEVFCCAGKEGAVVLQCSFVNAVSGTWDNI